MSRAIHRSHKPDLLGFRPLVHNLSATQFSASESPPAVLTSSHAHGFKWSYGYMLVAVLYRCGGLFGRLKDDSSQPHLRGHLHKRPLGVVDTISLAVLVLRVEPREDATPACPVPHRTASNGTKGFTLIHLVFCTSLLVRLPHPHGFPTPLPHGAPSHVQSGGGSTGGRPQSPSLNHQHDELYTCIYITIRKQQYQEP